MESKNKKGVSHIVIVITILVLCVLAATVIITLSSSMKGKKLIGTETETETVDGVERSKYIGYFADVDGDGTVDGVIFADLAYSASGEWGDSDGAFSYEAETGFKNYEIVEDSYSVDGAPGYGTKPVLKATGRGKDRFYVMALSDVTNTGTTADRFTWYDAAYDNEISDYLTVTSENFGTGKTNTETMLEKWNDAYYGTKNADNIYLDVWGVIQDKVEDGWFVPSRAEWSVFGKAFGLTSSNYENFGLRYDYWSSSLSNASGAYTIDFSNGTMCYSYLHSGSYVRLAATF